MLPNPFPSIWILNDVKTFLPYTPPLVFLFAVERPDRHLSLPWFLCPSGFFLGSDRSSLSHIINYDLICNQDDVQGNRSRGLYLDIFPDTSRGFGNSDF